MMHDCSEGMWKCHDFKCIDLTNVCDGISQCADGSDEQTCANWTCAKNWRKCNDGHQCIPDETICDGDNTCSDKSDEDGKFCIEYKCPSNFRKCANDWQCINDVNICDGIYHCLDLSDEYCDSSCLKASLGGKKVIIRKCKENTGVCLPVDEYCNGVADCPDASDEARSNCSCELWGLRTSYAADIRFCLHHEWCLVNELYKPMEQCSVNHMESHSNHMELDEHEINKNDTGRHSMYNLSK